ncbi:MAM and LDL-receptor class A domain-containing protein 2 [Halotydeus destructor]|nr:MAM and LDL-receptor class A domain-containing protein 2 [Halotydeus destructor]
MQNLSRNFSSSQLIIHILLLVSSKSPATSSTDASRSSGNCSSDTFECDGECIPGSARCNFRAECSDSSDEKGCTELSCNFENGSTCGWDLDHFEGSVRWKLINTDGSNSVIKSRNTMFHPRQGQSGQSYLLLDSTGGQVQHWAEVTSRPIRQSSSRCTLSFSYYCDREHCPLEVLIMAIDKDMKVKHLWRASEAMKFLKGTKRWTLGKLFIGHYEQFVVSFKVSISSEPMFVIALDNLQFEGCQGPDMRNIGHQCNGQFRCDNGHCIDHELVCDSVNDCFDFSDERFTLCTARTGLCDFESACDFWTKVDSNQVSTFIYANGKDFVNKEQFAFVPRTDHSLRSGEGTFFSLSSSRTQAQNGKSLSPSIATSRILSPILNGTSSQECTLRLWHNILGDSEEVKLNVYRKNVLRNSEHLLTSLTVGELTDFWQNLVLPLLNKDGDKEGDFQIIVEAIVPSFGHSVNLDDISLSAGCHLADGQVVEPVCPDRQYMCDNGNCFTTRQMCNFVDDCGDNSDEANCGLDCDFDEDAFCGWSIAEDAPFSWRLASGSSDGQNGPRTDSKSNSKGHYVITVADSDREVGNDNRATMMSTIFSTHSATCTFRLAYSIKGTNVLVVTLIDIDHDLSSKVLEVDDYDSDGLWNEATIKVPSTNGHPLKLVIHSPFSQNGFVAVDNLRFDKCDAISLVKRSDNCLSEDKLCNGIFDCDDGRDEIDCQLNHASCDFQGENWLEKCKWSSIPGQPQWSRTRSSIMNATENFMDRDYVLSVPSCDLEAGDVAVVSSPPFGPGECDVIVYYNIHGSNGSLLTVSTVSENNSTTIHHFTAVDNQAKWPHEKLTVGMDIPYRVQFSGKVGQKCTTDISIGNVWFSPSCPSPNSRAMYDTTTSSISNISRNETVLDEGLNVTGMVMLLVGVLCFIVILGLVLCKLFAGRQQRNIDKDVFMEVIESQTATGQMRSLDRPISVRSNSWSGASEEVTRVLRDIDSKRASLNLELDD